MIRNGIHIALRLCVVFLLAHCAKRKPTPDTFPGALGFCGNERLGEFDVVLNPSVKRPGLYDLKIVTVNVATPGGSYVRVALANEKLEYSEKVQYARIKTDRILYEGFVSPQELEAYSLIVIAPWKGGQSTFLTSLSEEDEAICRLPSTEPNSTGSGSAVVR